MNLLNVKGIFGTVLGLKVKTEQSNYEVNNIVQRFPSYSLIVLTHIIPKLNNNFHSGQSCQERRQRLRDQLDAWYWWILKTDAQIQELVELPAPLCCPQLFKSISIKLNSPNTTSEKYRFPFVDVRHSTPHSIVKYYFKISKFLYIN